MASIFYTKHPVRGDIDLKSPDIVYVEAEYDIGVREDAMVAAFRKAGLENGDNIFITVAYSDGHFKPGNVRNDPRQIRYLLLDKTEFVECQFRRKQ